MYRPHEVPSPAIMMFPFSIITEWPLVHSPPVTCGKDLCGWWEEEFILLMRRECEMKVRYAMFYNYHKLLNDQTTTKHKFITFFRPSPSRKTFYRDFFVSLRKSKSIIDWYTPDARHTAHLPKLMKVIKRISSLNIYTVSPDDDGEVRHVSYVWQCPMILHLACCSLDRSKTQVWLIKQVVSIWHRYACAQNLHWQACYHNCTTFTKTNPSADVI